MATEREIRERFVAVAESYKGAETGSPQHIAIVDNYNSYTPRARGYKLSYNDAWCAGAIGGWAVEAGVEKVIPMEVSVSKMIELAKKMHIWVEADDYIPKCADLMVYSWSDDGEGECDYGASHVGVVTEVEDGVIHVMEGNKGVEGVAGKRPVKIDGKYIRGFITPHYEKLASKKPSSGGSGSGKIRVGSQVRIKVGAKWYTGSKVPDWVLGRAWPVSEISGSRVVLDAGGLSSPIHIKYLYPSGSKPKPGKPKPKKVVEGCSVKVRHGAEDYSGNSLASFVYKTTYTVMEISGKRAVIGKGGVVTAAVKVSDLIVQ